MSGPAKGAAGGPPQNTNWAGVFLGLAIGVLAAFHQFKVPPAMPLLLDLYDYDLTIAGGFMSAYAAVGLATSALLGLGLQRFGVRRYVSIAGAVLVLGSLATVAWPALSGLVLASRALEGLGFAILAVSGPVIAIRSASIEHRPLAIAIFAAWIPIGQLLALGIAQPTVAAEQWRVIWWAGIALTILLIAAVWLAGRRRSSGAEPEAAPLRFADVPRARRLALVGAAALFTLWSGQYFAMSTWLPQYLVDARGLTAAGAVAPYAIPAAFVVIFNLVGGELLRRGVPIFPMLAVALAVQGVLWLLFTSFTSLWSGMAALAIYGAAAGITPTCLFSMPNTILGHRGGSGSAFGVIMTGRNLGVLAGPIILPQLLRATGAWDGVSPVFGALTLAAAAGTAGLGVFLMRLPVEQPSQTANR